MQISKSEYMMSLKHPAWVWLKKHQPTMLPKPDKALQARFDEGHAFERFVLELFPDAIELGFDDFAGYQSLTRRTSKALEGGAPTITQGRFEAGPVTCIVDVLHSTGDGAFDLVEIKSSTSVKDDHIFDLAFQRTVLEGAGLRIRDVYVFHVNREYRRNGKVDSQEFVTKTQVTDLVEDKMEFTQRAIARALQIVEQVSMPDPAPRHARLKSFSDWLEIYQAIQGALAQNSILRLPYINARTVNELMDAGIDTIDQLDDLSALTPGQVRYVEGFRSRARRVDTDGLSAFLETLDYPLYFLDYETSSSLVPPFDKLKPYQQLPFQYSLHIKRRVDSEIEHREFLHQSATNPVLPLLHQLQSDLGPEGSVLVWYAPFEKSRNTEMGELLPDHAPFLSNLNSRVVDLMDPFKKELIVDPGFGGSTSIKKVLPVLVPDLAYDELEIQEGEAASRLWKQATLDGMHEQRKSEIYEGLRQYCKLDTWAMVRIFEVLSTL